MENIITKRKSIYIIGLLSAIALVLGLFFNIYMAIFGQNNLVACENGFDLLSFRFSASYKDTIIKIVYNDEWWVELYELIFGILSSATVVMSIVSFVLILIALFKFDEESGKRIIITCFIISLLICATYFIFSLIFVLNITNELVYWEYSYSSFNGLHFYTFAYIPLIIQSVLFVGYFICPKIIDKLSIFIAINQSGKYVNSKQADGQNVYARKKKIGIEQILANDYVVIEIIKDYKKACRENIISEQEYEDKIEDIMKFSNKQLKVVPYLVRKAHYADVIRAEQTVVELLTEYNKLLENQIISEENYIVKKDVLVNLVINKTQE